MRVLRLGVLEVTPSPIGKRLVPCYGPTESVCTPSPLLALIAINNVLD
jgi:hypothetical protein